MPWSKIILRSVSASHSDSQAEELGCDLIEAGALGTSLEDDGRITCFVEHSPSVLEAIYTVAQARGFQVVSTEDLGNENWTQQCSDVWHPITTGKLRVIPVESSSAATSVGDFDLQIIPGLGFGTGHHPTTNMILRHLSYLAESGQPPPSSVFDLGTGSGILAIAAAKLFRVPVIANDIDLLALGNAGENAAINGVANLITLVSTPTEALNGCFDLILGNVYGEVLIQLMPAITRLAAPGATLILSGISELVCDNVLAAYTTSQGSWDVEHEYNEDGWMCLALRQRA